MKMKKLMKYFYILMAAILVFSTAGCHLFTDNVEAKSNHPRETNPIVEQKDWQEFISGNHKFTLDLYQELIKSQENLFFSPYSISSALAMTYGGARTTTEEQMAQVLQTSLTQERYHAAFNKLDQSLASREKTAGEDEKDAFQLKIANALWGQKDFPFLTDYLDMLAENYGAGMQMVDFVNSPDPSRIKINDWVADQTKNKIKDLLPEGSINPLTRLVLTNAIYFKASWLNQFSPNATHKDLFTLLDGSTVDVNMMSREAGMRYASGEGYQLVSIPYSGSQVSMLIFLPAEGKFSEFEAGITVDKLEGMIRAMKYSQVDLSLPKFKLETKFEAADQLISLGMVDAFDPNKADFSGMDGKKDLYISNVYHQAFVDVNEEGTEAAAATGLVVMQTSLPVDVVEMNVNRPFIFLIYDQETESILFMGRILKP